MLSRLAHSLFSITLHWLGYQNFADRISLSPLYFIGAGLTALVIAWVTTFVHAYHVARANPIPMRFAMNRIVAGLLPRGVAAEAIRPSLKGGSEEVILAG